MQCSSIPIELPAQRTMPCKVTELQILLDDPEEVEYENHGTPKLNQLYTFIAAVKVKRENGKNRAMLPSLFKITVSYYAYASTVKVLYE